MKKYTTDGKVTHLSKDEDINSKLSRLIGEKYDDYRVDWNRANDLELVTEFPLFLHFDMNQKCNLKCPHCIVSDEQLLKKYYSGENLNFSKYARAIDEGREYGCPSVSVQGNNEPLLNKELEKYIKYASTSNYIDIMMNSNASALTRDRSRSILDSGLTRLRFSLDAYYKTTFEKIRVGGDYDRVLRNIDNFLDIIMNFLLWELVFVVREIIKKRRVILSIFGRIKWIL